MFHIYKLYTQMCIFYVFINLYMIYILLTITKTIYILIKNIFKNKIKNIYLVCIFDIYTVLCVDIYKQSL